MKFFKRLFCLHRAKETTFLQPHMSRGIKQWRCVKCGKKFWKDSDTGRWL